jgi:hypothetical protein
MLLYGEKVILKPMTIEQISIFYKWATQSDATYLAIRVYEKAGFKITKTFIKNKLDWYRMKLKK